MFMGIFQTLKDTGSDPVESIRDFLGFLVACKNEGDPIKDEGARVVTTLFIDFSNAQGQLTSKLVMESCLI